MVAILLALALGAGPAEGAEGRVVERIVAVVRNPAGASPRPITLTRLAEEARVALVGQGALQAATAPLDAAALRAALRWLVDQLLVADEAARLKVDDVSREEVDGALRRFRERLGPEAAFRAFLASSDLAEEDLVVALTRDLKVRRYLESRVGRAARVTEAELAEAMAAREGSPGAAGAREAVRTRLAAEKAQAQARQLIAELRARAEVRVLDPELREGAAP